MHAATLVAFLRDPEESTPVLMSVQPALGRLVYLSSPLATILLDSLEVISEFPELVAEVRLDSTTPLEMKV